LASDIIILPAFFEVMVDNIYNKFEEQQYLIGIYLDLQKGFDTVKNSCFINHTIIVYVVLLTNGFEVICQIGSNLLLLTELFPAWRKLPVVFRMDQC